jgi:hypothetical protein
MPDPLASRRTHLRRQRLAQRLLALIDTLGTFDRRAELPRPVAGAARRTLGEAAAFLGTKGPPPGRRPADIFVATLQQVGVLAARSRRDDPAVAEAGKKIYPRPKRQA